MDSKDIKRREFLIGSAAATALLIIPGCPTSATLNNNLDLASASQSPDLASSGGSPDLSGGSGSPDLLGGDLAPTPSCDDTVPQILGPFYRANAPTRTILPSPTPQKPVLLHGVVRGQKLACGFISGAAVEIWQADEDGDYDNTTSQFLLRGTQVVANDGSYQFTTILPGWYLNGSVYRPRHIHYKVSAPGYKTLVTQLYFKDDPYLATDPFYHPSLVMPLIDQGSSFEAIFDIVLASA